jgi:hypothetical protein
MGRGLIAGLVALGLLTACSGGGGSAGKTTTTSTTTTSTTLATTSTTNPEDAVKQAWNDYWAMVVRLGEHPDGADPELAQRAVDPLLASLKADYSTRASQGRFVVAGPRYEHRFDSVTVDGNSAHAVGCKIDDSKLMDPSGVIDDEVATYDIAASFVFDNGSWKASNVQFTNKTQGISGCANS